MNRIFVPLLPIKLHKDYHFMRKILLITIAFTFCTLQLFAGSPWLKRPLRFVSADSVLVWGYDGRDCRNIALKCSKDAMVYPILLTQKEWKERKHIYKEWITTSRKINNVGEFDAADNDHTMYDVATALTRAMQLFRMQGDAQYADFAERTLYNATMHTANDSTLIQGSIERQLAANLLFTMPGLIYATSPDNDVYVNIYTNSTASIRTASMNFTLDQITNMPLSGSVKLRFNNLKPNTPLRLHLRMPDWLNMRKGCIRSFVGTDSLMPSIFVNGHEIENFKVDEKGYVTIDRTWNALDEVYFDIPLQMQRIVPNNTKKNVQPEGAFSCNNIGWQFGPLVYQLEAPGYFVLPTWHPLIDNELSASGFPMCKIMLSKKQSATMQQKVKHADYFKLLPYADGTNHLATTETTHIK